MNYLLALDQGTTSSRAIIFDFNGTIVASEQQEFPQYFPQSGWVEQNAGEILNSQLAVAAQVIRKAAIRVEDIAAAGITNQRESTVIWDRRTGQAIAPVIVWQDRRTARFCDRLRADGLVEMFRSKTGLVIDAYFSGTKIKWILDHVPDARKLALEGHLAFGTVDSWLLWNLSADKCHKTDVSNASRTLLYNIHEKCWDQEILELFAIPESILPQVVSSSEVYGETRSSLFGSSISIAGSAGDQQAALFGQGCLQRGMVKNTYGTGCFILMNTGQKAIESKNQLLTTVAWEINGKTDYALEGSVFIAGAVVQWLRDGLKIIGNAGEVEELARKSAGQEDLILVPAFTGLGAPHWDPYARGMLIGVTRSTSQADIAAAALQSIAYQVSDVINAMEKDSGINLRELRVDGGASVNDYLMQFQANILNLPVVRTSVSEATAWGAARLAGCAVGVLESQTDLNYRQNIIRGFEPEWSDDYRKMLLDKWEKAISRAKNWT